MIFKERRLGVDVLDSVFVMGCLATLHVFPGAIVTWCLSIGRYLVRRTEDNSKKMLLGAFGKQPRYVWLVRTASRSRCRSTGSIKGDIVVVHTGEMVPVDGIIVEGLAMIDQHALTGELAPVEKGVGDRVFASTVMVAGKVHVAVEKSGGETATARIAQILNDSAGYKLASQHKGEQFADKAVIPTLGLGGLALATIGPTGRGRGRQQRPRNRHPDGGTTGDAVDLGALRAEGCPGQGRARARSAVRGRYGALRQDRYIDARAARGRARNCRQRFSSRPRFFASPPRPSAGFTTRWRWQSCRRRRSRASICRRPTRPNTRSAMASRSASTGIRVRVGSRRFMELEGVPLTPRG